MPTRERSLENAGDETRVTEQDLQTRAEVAMQVTTENLIPIKVPGKHISGSPTPQT